MPDQLPLETAGIGAIALALIWVLYKIVSNHISHNTEIMVELKEAVHKLTEVLERKL